MTAPTAASHVLRGKASPSEPGILAGLQAKRQLGLLDLRPVFSFLSRWTCRRRRENEVIAQVLIGLVEGLMNNPAWDVNRHSFTNGVFLVTKQQAAFSADDEVNLGRIGVNVRF